MVVSVRSPQHDGGACVREPMVDHFQRSGAGAGGGPPVSGARTQEHRCNDKHAGGDSVCGVGVHVGRVGCLGTDRCIAAQSRVAAVAVHWRLSENVQ